jgi:hypothetical protein
VRANRAFLAGIALYALGMVALKILFEMLAFGVHAFLVFRWFQGQRTQELHRPAVSIFSATRPAGK